VKPQTADLAVSVSDAPDPVQTGSPLTYTIAITNLGPATVDEIALVIELPFSTEVVGTPAEALCAAQPSTTPPTVDCGPRMLNLAPGRVFTLLLRATPPRPGTVALTVRLVLFAVGSSREIISDPNPTNNTATTTTTVTGTGEVEQNPARRPETRGSNPGTPGGRLEETHRFQRVSL
jgi:uncharacterized repeat protein (TIGR01451 family)